MTRALVVLALFLTGCTASDLVAPHPSFTPQQRAGMVALGGQMMAAPTPPAAYQPSRCYTRNVYGTLVTNCY